jgi:hypothetical protein
MCLKMCITPTRSFPKGTSTTLCSMSCIAGIHAKEGPTNSIELSPFREAANCTVTLETASILWNKKVHYRVHKGPPLVPIPSQINAVLTISFSLSQTTVLILFSHLHLDLPTGLFPSGRPHQ